MAGPEPPVSPRATITSLMLTGMFVVFFVGLLIMATGGWFLYLLAAFAVILLFAGIHYVLWGWMMPPPPDAQDEDDHGDKAPEGWPLPDSDRYTRF